MPQLERPTATPAGLRVNTIVLAFTLVSGLVVFLRMFTRLALSKRAGFGDACIVLAMVLSIALAVLTSKQVMNGLGERSSRLTPTELDTLLKSFWASVWIYNLALTITKVSILVHYLQIFRVRRFRIACFAVIGLVVAYGAWAVLSSVLICTPVAFSWDKNIPNGRCMNQLVVWVVNAGMNIVQDLVIFAMPLPVIGTLQIPQSHKKGLVTIVFVGLSVTLVSVIRLYTLDEISNSTDVSLDNPAHATLSAVEVNMGIICACLLPMRPLLARILPQYFSAAPQYNNTPLMYFERSKHMQSHPGSTRNHTARTSTLRAVTSRVATPPRAASRTDSAQGDIPLQSLKPILSRTPSGRFSVTNSRPTTPHFPSSQVHSRTASNTSANSSAAATRTRSNTNSQSRMDPLRMSPIIPFSPPLPIRAASPLAPGSYTRRPSAPRTPVQLPPRTPRTDKRLPITPFPIGPGG
ncbi:hypothetical protein BDW02DRAFT_581484 [Decorospora gaudefroyi]|uniref:Rhodopsin domain-containing protein n=1 Tax=Decorospora gaudefroyi TaxID=184978 RepID=A0A6A5K597_9PLEO|nr:hypothetical protein BDW02DRAFT_581484 [Decorospora gaudefroyi]